MPRSALAKGLAAAAVIGVLASLLSACSTTVNASTDDSVCGPYTSGASSEAVTASGRIGSKPKVSFPTPLVSPRTELSQLVTGSGPAVGSNDLAQVGIDVYTGVLGASKVIIEGGYAGGDASASIVIPAGFAGQDGKTTTLGRSLECRTAGSRYVLTGGLDSMLGTGYGDYLGVPASTVVVAVVDVRSVFSGSANGLNQLQTSGLPAVVTAVNGTPGIVLPGSTPPKHSTSALVKAGGGAVVRSKDTVVVKYSEFTWPTDGTKPSQSLTSWDDKQAATIAVSGSSETSRNDQVSWASKLKGMRVGSQFIQAVPGSAGNDATIWVVDVLGIVR